MNTNVGLWIDHREAVIVSVTDKNFEYKLIKSNIEKQPGRFKGKRSTTSYESQMVQADDVQERHFMGLLDIYYDEVIAFVRNADAILVFGPGEAKGELVKRLKKNKICVHIESVETVDKMTHPQIVAKVKQYFLNHTAAKQQSSEGQHSELSRCIF